jgi:hypothetical protein
VQAIQAHPVPTHVHEPYGPFPSELFEDPEIVYEYQSEDDDGTTSLPLGATAQNNYKPEKVYRCRHCHARVAETDFEIHTCGE